MRSKKWYQQFALLSFASVFVLVITFYWNIVPYNVVLISTVQQSENIYMYTYIPSFFAFPSRLGYHRALNCVSLTSEIIHLFICLRVFLKNCLLLSSNFSIGVLASFLFLLIFQKLFFPYSFILKNNQHRINSTYLEYTIFEL